MACVCRDECTPFAPFGLEDRGAACAAEPTDVMSWPTRHFPVDKLCWEDLEDDASTAPPSPRDAPGKASRAMWADLEDSDDEFTAPTIDAAPAASFSDSWPQAQAQSSSEISVPCRAPKTQWADLVDSDTEFQVSPSNAALPSVANIDTSSSFKGQAQQPALVSNHTSPSSRDQAQQTFAHSSSRGSKGKGQGGQPAWAKAKQAARPLQKSTPPSVSETAPKQKRKASEGRVPWSEVKQPWARPWQPRRQSVATTSISAKPQCQFFIGIDEEPKFKVTRKLLGSHGKHMKSIAEQSGAKLRLRGKGSGFLEGPEQEESSDPFMLCVSALDQPAYEKATKLVWELIEDVYEQYRTFCKAAKMPIPHLNVNMHEGPRPGSF